MNTITTTIDTTLLATIDGPWWLRLLLPEVELEVAVDVAADVGNDGIGSYEYHGQRCFDAGHACVEDIAVYNVTFEDDQIPFFMRNKWGRRIIKRALLEAADSSSDNGDIREQVENQI